MIFHFGDGFCAIKISTEISQSFDIVQVKYIYLRINKKLYLSVSTLCTLSGSLWFLIIRKLSIYSWMYFWNLRMSSLFHLIKIYKDLNWYTL